MLTPKPKVWKKSDNSTMNWNVQPPLSKRK